MQATLDSLSAHIAILDESGTVIAVNAPWKRFAQNNGFAGQDAGLGSNYLNVCAAATGQDADEAADVLNGVLAVLNGERDDFYLEYPCHGPDESRWFSLRATRFLGEDGASMEEGERGRPQGLPRVVVSHENITARKLAEIRLREESQIIETMYQVGQMVAGERELSRIIKSVVDAALSLSGASIGAFLPMTSERLLAAQALYGTMEGGVMVARSGTLLPLSPQFWEISQLVRFDDNGQRWAFDTEVLPFLCCLLAPVTARSGQRLGALLLGRESGSFDMPDERLMSGLAFQAAVALENALLFERVQSEREAAAESEAQYRFATEFIPQMVWTTNPQGAHEYFNAQWYEFTGQSRSVSLGEGWALPLHPDDVQRAKKRWAQSLESGELYEIEYRFKRYDGVYRWFLGRALPMRDENGQIIRWFGTCTDIDDQKRTENEKNAALEREANSRREAEDANRIKDEFLAVVSHELRTPLTPILGWISMLRSEDDDPALRRQGYDTIERNAKAQSQIINDLLDVSRIITGKLKLEMQSLDLRRVLLASIETVEPAAKARSVQIVQRLDDHVEIVGDSDRLQQVFWNLLSNAIKFTPKHGRVEVRLAKVESTIQVEISDSGQGIEREFLPYVFERFRQADATSTRSHGGLGLGLSIVRNLVEQHGGEVAAYSAGRGQGSTFTVRLPIAPVAPDFDSPTQGTTAGASAFSAPRTALSHIHVLIVDDETDSRDMLSMALKRYGARVTTAGSVPQALELFQNEIPDVILSDIGMPGEDGYSLIKRIRSLPAEQGGDVPALALTAYARAEDRARALSEGFQNHLSKPASPVELVVTLGALLSKRH